VAMVIIWVTARVSVSFRVRFRDRRNAKTPALN